MCIRQAQQPGSLVGSGDVLVFLVLLFLAFAAQTVAFRGVELIFFSS